MDNTGRQTYLHTFHSCRIGATHLYAIIDSDRYSWQVPDGWDSYTSKDEPTMEQICQRFCNRMLC